MINELTKCTAVIDEGIQRGLHIGAQVCVSLCGKVVADFARGLARDGHELRTDHRMLWLSAGKPLLAVAIGQLWEQGRLDVEDHVAHFLPEFASHGKAGILIRHLLTHTHGYHPPAVDWPRLTWAMIIEQICNSRVPEGRSPGKYAAYDAQTGWYLLAEIVQRVTGEPFYDYVSREVLQPIGCRDSSIGLRTGEYRALLGADGIAPLHDTAQSARDGVNLGGGGGRVWAGDNEQRSAARNPGGGALGTARDLCRFYVALDKTWHGEREGKWLSQATLFEMTKPQREGVTDHTFKQRVDWGLGFLLNSFRSSKQVTPYGYGSIASEQTFGHGGVQSTSAFCDPKTQLCVAITFNGLPGEAKHHERVNELITTVYEECGIP